LAALRPERGHGTTRPPINRVWRRRGQNATILIGRAGTAIAATRDGRARRPSRLGLLRPRSIPSISGKDFGPCHHGGGGKTGCGGRGVREGSVDGAAGQTTKCRPFYDKARLRPAGSAVIYAKWPRWPRDGRRSSKQACLPVVRLSPSSPASVAPPPTSGSVSGCISIGASFAVRFDRARHWNKPSISASGAGASAAAAVSASTFGVEPEVKGRPTARSPAMRSWMCEIERLAHRGDDRGGLDFLAVRPQSSSPHRPANADRATIPAPHEIGPACSPSPLRAFHS